ncbi:MAG: hypothetical protein ACRCSG_07100 [Cellulosilyticaceae bacterium]
MINKEKIIVMSKLAVLEKNHIEKDFKATTYYLKDYIYINNIITRISILCIVGGILSIYIFTKLETDIVIPTTWMELFLYYIIPYGSILALSLFVFSLISKSVYRQKYKTIIKRVDDYQKLYETLETIDDSDNKDRVETTYEK